MSPHSLLLDDGIRVWVLLPITVAMFLVGVLRHLATKLMSSKPAAPADADDEGKIAQLREAQAVMRSQVRLCLSSQKLSGRTVLRIVAGPEWRHAIRSGRAVMVDKLWSRVRDACSLIAVSRSVFLVTFPTR